MTRAFLSGGLLLSVTLLSGCAAPLAHATAEDALRAQERWPGTTVASLEDGRRLFVFRCSGCHGLRLPDTVPVAKWPRLLDDMQKEAHLDVEERAAIERFILTIATRPTPSDGGVASSPGPSATGT